MALTPYDDQWREAYGPGDVAPVTARDHPLLQADHAAATCECTAELRFDPSVEGETCGGLLVAGAMVCAGGCGAPPRLCDRSVPSEAWKLAKGGRSVDASGTRIRCEAGPGTERLMARVARLPDLERALRAIAAGAADAAAVARAALEMP